MTRVDPVRSGLNPRQSHGEHGYPIATLPEATKNSKTRCASEWWLVRASVSFDFDTLYDRVVRE